MHDIGACKPEEASAHWRRYARNGGQTELGLLAEDHRDRKAGDVAWWSVCMNARRGRLRPKSEDSLGEPAAVPHLLERIFDV